MERLRSSTAIRAALRRGTVTRRPTLVVHALARSDGPPRVAVVAGRKLGSAVRRNRAKRRLRAALRSLALPKAIDLVVVARPPALRAPFARIVEDLRAALEAR